MNRHGNGLAPTRKSTRGEWALAGGALVAVSGAGVVGVLYGLGCLLGAW